MLIQLIGPGQYDGTTLEIEGNPSEYRITQPNHTPPDGGPGFYLGIEELVFRDTGRFTNECPIARLFELHGIERRT